MALLEPPLDLLARLPLRFCKRAVSYGPWSALRDTPEPRFLKPASPLRKVFDAGVYRSLDQIGERFSVEPEFPVLESEPVDWLSEYRVWVLEGRFVATSRYVRFGRIAWQPWPANRSVDVPPGLLELCSDLHAECADVLPPAFVVDIGFIEGRGWAVVEFNPAWCSAIQGANPAAILPVLQRACRRRSTLPAADVLWTDHSFGRTAGQVGSVVGSAWDGPNRLALVT